MDLKKSIWKTDIRYPAPPMRQRHKQTINSFNTSQTSAGTPLKASQKTPSDLAIWRRRSNPGDSFISPFLQPLLLLSHQHPTRLHLPQERTRPLFLPFLYLIVPLYPVIAMIISNLMRRKFDLRFVLMRRRTLFLPNQISCAQRPWTSLLRSHQMGELPH